ncbi:membrane protein, partial [Variovorax paradoxus]
SYTTHLTQVWTVYFAVVVVSSIVVYLTMPFSAWSLLANVLSPVSVGLLFVGEHLIRYRLHPEFERTRLVDAVRAFYGTSTIDNGAGPR